MSFRRIGLNTLVASTLSRLSLAVTLSLVAVGWFAPMVRAANEIRTVTAIGRAQGRDLKAKDEALADAKRQAVAQACGEYINAQTVVESFAVVKDRILTQAAGFIKDFDVRREWQSEGMAHCEITARVAMGKFKVEWFVHLLEDMGNPRFVVILGEDNDTVDANPPQSNGICQSKLEKFLIENHVEVFSADQLEASKKRELELANIRGDTDAITAAVGGIRADLVVCGLAKATMARTSTGQGYQLYHWDASLTASLVEVDSGRKLVADTIKLPEGHVTTKSSGGGDEALEKLGTEAGGQVIRALAESWMRKTDKPYQVQLQHCSHADFTPIEQALRAIRGIQSIQLREQVGDTAIIDVRSAFGSSHLAKTLEELSVDGAKMRIIDKTGNRIAAEVIR